MSDTYATRTDGEWFAPSRRDYRLVCCDCGLVHKVEFRVKKGQLQMRGFRDRAATRRQRTKMGVREADEATFRRGFEMGWRVTIAVLMNALERAEVGTQAQADSAWAACRGSQRKVKK